MFNGKVEMLLKAIIVQNELLATMKLIELKGKINSESYEALERSYKNTSKATDKALTI